jgi:hypothetical protein
MDHCDNQVEELRHLIRELETPPVKQGVWQKFVENTRKVLQK